MKILVTFALDSEFAPWQRMRPWRRVRGESGVFESQFAAASLQVVLTGVGPAHATRTTSRALSLRPDICISSGTAGALRPSFTPGHILAAGRVVSNEFSDAAESHPLLLEVALAAGARPAAAFLTAPFVLGTAAEKQRSSSLADAVEMESHSVLTEAARWRVPAVAVRAISDAADRDLPLDFNRVLDAAGRVRVSLILSELARRPHRLPALLRVGRDSRRACHSLAHFLDRFVTALAAQPDLVRALSPQEVA